MDLKTLCLLLMVCCCKKSLILLHFYSAREVVVVIEGCLSATALLTFVRERSWPCVYTLFVFVFRVDFVVELFNDC